MLSVKYLITYKRQQLNIMSLLNGDSRLHNRSTTLKHGCTAEKLLHCQLRALHRIDLWTAHAIVGRMNVGVQSPMCL